MSRTAKANLDEFDADIREILMDLPPLLGLADVARLVGRSKVTVKRWVAAGRVSRFRTSPTGSGAVLISRREVGRLLVSMRVAD